MSAVGTNPPVGGASGLLLPILFVALVAGAFLWIANRAEETTLRASASGFDGLAQWLRTEGADVEIRTSRWFSSQEDYGLQITPVFDTNLRADRAPARDEDALLNQFDERDERWADQRRKQTLAPTMYVLPKWRTGMRLSRRAHPEFTILSDDPKRLRMLARLPQTSPGTIKTLPGGFRDFPVRGSLLKATLYAPQVFAGGECEPLIGDREAMVLGVCEAVGAARGGPEKVWMLSDPDLLNNHGLSLGNNAALASELLQRIAGAKPIIVDYEPTALTRTNAPPPARSWSDMLRFFSYPFSLLWIGGAAFMMLATWRSWVRYGAPAKLFDDEMSAAKDLSVAAKARLLRLSGHDGALVADYARSRLQTIAAIVFGPHRKQTNDPLPPLAAWLARRDAALASRLETAATAARDLAPNAPAGEALHVLDEFETCIERVLDDLGGTQGRG